MAVLTVYLTASWYDRPVIRPVPDGVAGREPARRPAAGTAGIPASSVLRRFPVGLFWVAFSRENRSLQDVVLRTSVIHDWLIRVPRKN